MKNGDQPLQIPEEPVASTVLGYLTGSLSPEECASFEQHLLEDEFFAAQVEQAEFLLVEMYADGSLPTAARAKVGAWIDASPRRHSQAAIASALRRSALKPSRPRTRWAVGFAVAAACLTAAVLLRVYPPRGGSHLGSPPALQTASIVPSRSLPPVPSRPDTILLVAERLRGAEPASPITYSVHASAAVRLQILVPALHAASTYTLDLKNLTAQASSPTHFSNLSLQGSAKAKYVEALLPPHCLATGSYEADLRAPGESFRVRFQVAASK